MAPFRAPPAGLPRQQARLAAPASLLWRKAKPRAAANGVPAPRPPPVDGYAQRVGPAERALLDSVLSCSAIGAPGTVRASMQAFIERTGADELLVTSQIFDQAHRLRSYEITGDLFTSATHQAGLPVLQ